MSANVSRKATESGRVRQRLRRSRAAHAFPAVCRAQFAGLIILAHLLVAAHTIAHFYQPSFEPASQHCAICKIGKQSAGLSATVIAASPFMATWIGWFASPPAPIARCLDGANIARAPPSAAQTVAIS